MVQAEEKVETKGIKVHPGLGEEERVPMITARQQVETRLASLTSRPTSVELNSSTRHHQALHEASNRILNLPLSKDLPTTPEMASQSAARTHRRPQPSATLASNRNSSTNTSTSKATSSATISLNRTRLSNMLRQPGWIRTGKSTRLSMDRRAEEAMRCTRRRCSRRGAQVKARITRVLQQQANLMQMGKARLRRPDDQRKKEQTRASRCIRRNNWPQTPTRIQTWPLSPSNSRG